MSDKSGIEWTDATWNPVTGCNKVSEGCKHCYAERMAKRLQAMGAPRYANGFAVTLHPDALDKPLHWKRPRRIFVNSMSDLFHPDVPDEFVDEVFAVMAMAPQHIFQILTKRPERMRDYLNAPYCEARTSVCMGERGFMSEEEIRNIAPPGSIIPKDPAWPLPNVWLGTSVENQRRADERIPHLLRTPAAVRFLSCEPLLGPLDLWNKGQFGGNVLNPRADGSRGIDWIIVGGESGPGARPMDADWARSLRDQCRFAGVPFFFKQWGGARAAQGGHAEALLDGELWKQMPGKRSAS